MTKGIYPSYLYVDRSRCEAPLHLQHRKRGRREWLEDFADVRELRLGVKHSFYVPISVIGLEVVELHFVEVVSDFPTDKEAATRAIHIGNILVEEWLDMQDPHDPLTHMSDTLARI